MSSAPQGSWAVEAQGLTKSYGAVRVLSGLDLRVRRGSVFALLGPNGAGKTTTVRALTTLTRADSGRAWVAGHDVVAERARVRRAISLTGQYAALDEEQTGEENLRMMARLRGRSRAEAGRLADGLLERFALTDAARRRVSTYSGGMRRRLDIAAGLVTDPEVVFLDEPTTGLDPRSRRTMWEVVSALAGSGITVFLTTQYLEEADRLADHVAVLGQGRVIAEGSPDELKKRVAAQRLDLTLTDRHAYEAMAARLDGRAVHRAPEELLLGVATDGSAPHVRALLDELDPARVEISRFALHGATLDDVFLELTHE
ncbi:MULTISPECIES: ATP-binding cassette domain-containing protein [unclassified Streptomyces]|uniref:ATP-binding cassette domain-containing protein n=1 Tax=unclassified Streptomyces TaxID=2593676 RepID=UPI002DD8C4A4|nr:MULTISPECIES: ATP-binding cassette domain-containing protein [unclassified Streptomyces]WSA94845.1 ATP-binding cassette domain-containing protein [Streptomyces sp. NBC_01795]WSB79265.1 ATP-binding cassette domain-containing protein [Streptomyces sp. NBC_01775]WSS41317.1 ATP-binding cassette domain-containing protein [Streptomyces sp. NBC_01187]